MCGSEGIASVISGVASTCDECEWPLFSISALALIFLLMLGAAYAGYRYGLRTSQLLATPVVMAHIEETSRTTGREVMRQVYDSIDRRLQTALFEAVPGLDVGARMNILPDNPRLRGGSNSAPPLRHLMMFKTGPLATTRRGKVHFFEDCPRVAMCDHGLFYYMQACSTCDVRRKRHVGQEYEMFCPESHVGLQEAE